MAEIQATVPPDDYADPEIHGQEIEIQLDG
jgi:hypothetical protein